MKLSRWTGASPPSIIFTLSWQCVGLCWSAGGSDISAEEWQKLEAAYPSYKSIVRSDIFKSWLGLQDAQFQRLAETSKTAAGAISVLDAFQRSRIRNGGEGFVRLSCGLKVATGRPTEPVLTQTLWVDFLTMRVNGSAAQITTEFIRFTIDTPDPTRATIDRFSGAYEVGDAKFPMLATGQCSKAGSALF